LIESANCCNVIPPVTSIETVVPAPTLNLNEPAVLAIEVLSVDCTP